MLSVAVVGGGQLGRMMQQAAVGMGVHLRALVEAPDSSTAQVVPDAVVGLPGDPGALAALIEGVDVLTFEHEHVSGDLLRTLTDRVAVHPGPGALLYAQDKEAMRQRLTEAGIACPRWAMADEPEAQEIAAGGAIAKLATGGYDGRGVRAIDSLSQVGDWLAAGQRVLIEERVDFVRELAVLVARRPSGQVVSWPVVETRQVDGMCHTVIAPAPGLEPGLADELRSMGEGVAEQLEVTGVLAVELFELRTPDAGGRRYAVNELAMRPHNCGHWTINGARTSQFEQHLRAVLDLPLGDPAPREPVSVMVNIVGTEGTDYPASLPMALESDPGIAVHWYGKGVRPGRKLGHVTAMGEDTAEVLARATRAAAILAGS